MKPRKIWMLSAVFSLILFFTVLSAQNIFAQTQSDAQKSQRNLQFISYLYEFLQKYYVDSVDPDVLYHGAMEGMLNALEDPYTMYIYNDSLTGVDLHDTTTGFFGGIGISFIKPAISTPEKPAFIEVASPIEDTPSSRAGIQAGDFITKIEDESTVEMTTTDVVSKLRGKIGTPVTVTVRRGKTMEFPVTLIRAKIEVPTIKMAKITDTIGYIRLLEFNPNSYPRVKEAIESFQKEGVQQFILDLRNNPGGLITAAVDTASLFVPEGVIVSTKSRIPEQNIVFKANPRIPAVFADVPLVILINKGSASASEILAGALKDYKRSYLIGETTFGKGVVQMIFDLTKENSFKMTVSRYYTPSDANIHKMGIKPDREVLMHPPLTADDEKNLERLLKDEKITQFVKSKKDLSAQDIFLYAKKLAAEYSLNTEITRRLIRLEYNRKHKPPVVDIDYDPQVQEAVKILQSGNLNRLIRNSKSVRELQEEDAAKKEAAEKQAS